MRTRSALVAGATALCAALATVAACTASPAPGPTCLTSGEKVVQFPAGSGKLPAVVIGNGGVGLILAHQYGGDMCQWIDEARFYAGLGYRSMVFDFAGFGWADDGSPDPDRDVAAAGEFLKSLGVRGVAIVGASMGGGAAVAAAPSLTVPVLAVVSLSGSQGTFGVDAIGAAAHHLTAPLLCVAAQNDSGYADTARKLCAEGAPGPRQVLIVSGTSHGVFLYRDEPSVKPAVTAFLAQYAPPGGSAANGSPSSGA
jgi:pimeloyl-ACP methyl ester carboxylesterase